MAEVTENQKLPWPSRLSDSSKRFLILGVIISVLGIPVSYFLGLVGMFLIVPGAGVIMLSFVCAWVAFVGLLCYKFRIPGTEKALGVIVIGFPFFVFAMAAQGDSFSVWAKHLQKRMACTSNIKTLYRCCEMYHADSRTRPISEKWCDLIKPYVMDTEKNPFQCPKDEIGPCSYAMNKNIPADANDLPPDLVLLFESAPGWNQTGGSEDVVTDRHYKNNYGANIAFADGSVKFIKTEDIPKLRWTIGEK